jgi:[ribosomal protein S5]-alanine N-acetyltransferase
MRLPKKLVTQRLLLRPIQKDDVDDIVEGINNLNVSKWLLKVPYPYHKKDAQGWVTKKIKKKNDMQFILELKSEKKAIGAMGLHQINLEQGTATTGYWLSEKYWRYGYGSEALGAVLDVAFNKLNLRKVEAAVFVGNPASGKLLEKFGGQIEGLKRKAVISKATGKIMDEYIYGILKEDYKKAVKKINKNKKLKRG